MERVKRIFRFGSLNVILLAFIFACSILLMPLYAEETPDEVHIDADSVVYQENTGTATADGNVKVRNKTIFSFAFCFSAIIVSLVRREVLSKKQ